MLVEVDLPVPLIEAALSRTFDADLKLEEYLCELIKDDLMFCPEDEISKYQMDEIVWRALCLARAFPVGLTFEPEQILISTQAETYWNALHVINRKRIEKLFRTKAIGQVYVLNGSEYTIHSKPLVSSKTTMQVRRL